MPNLIRIGSVCLLAVTFLGLSGCAFGRNELTGEIVGGIELGRLADTTNSALSAAGSMLPPPWGGIAEFALPAIAAGGLIHGRSRSTAKRESDAAYDEGKAAGLAEAERAKRAYDEARLREAYKRADPKSFDGPAPGAGGGTPVPA